MSDKNHNQCPKCGTIGVRVRGDQHNNFWYEVGSGDTKSYHAPGSIECLKKQLAEAKGDMRVQQVRFLPVLFLGVSLRSLILK